MNSTTRYRYQSLVYMDYTGHHYDDVSNDVVTYNRHEADLTKTLV
jgi:hypothetical protein